MHRLVADFRRSTAEVQVLLNLAETQIDDAALEALQAVKSLRSLDVSLTDVSQEAVEAFRRAVPECEVKR